MQLYLDDLERPLLRCTKHASFRAYNENLNEDRPNTISSEDVAK